MISLILLNHKLLKHRKIPSWKKFYTPISVHWTFELQEFILYLQDNNSNEIVVYFHQVPEHDLFEILKLIHTEEILNINDLNFRSITYFN